MIVVLHYHVDYMEYPSEIPLDENCVKCAFRQNGRCLRRDSACIKECGYGRKGYYSLRKITDEGEK